jgi:hypothetical protein
MKKIVSYFVSVMTALLVIGLVLLELTHQFSSTCNVGVFFRISHISFAPFNRDGKLNFYPVQIWFGC